MPSHALVTGASSGLGRELVRQLVLDRGMTVLATARRLDRLEALARELPEGRVQVLSGDLADSGFRDRLWKAAEQLPGGLELLVNNAGLGHYADLADQDMETIQQILNVNLVALIDLTRRGIPHMKARGGGQILEVSSVLGFIGLPYSAVYVASKHAVNGLVKSLRYELRGSRVRVWAACPGQTDSEFFSSALGGGTRSGTIPKGADTTAVVRAIVRGIDRNRGFLFPGFVPWATVTLAHWLPGPFDWGMGRWSARFFGHQISRARSGAANPSAGATQAPAGDPENRRSP